MRKLFTLALVTALLIFGCSTLMPAASEQATKSEGMSPAQVESNAIEALHHDDVPTPSPFLTANETDESGTLIANEIVYGAIAGTPLTGYLARPPQDDDIPLPGLIVIQEWWGLNDNIKTMTRQLASEGYVALAVDLYDDQVAETPEEALTLVEEALEQPERLEQNVVEAYNYLTETANAPTVGSIGWCFGGTWSLNTALALPEDLDAAVIYYGGGITTERDRLATLQMPIQGHFGLLDTRPDPETVQTFETVLDDLGKTAEIYQYADAGHAFANPSGTRYNEAAAKLSWKRTIAFLNQHL